jgi:Putative Flp pilus-assembly TadE/G-like
MSKHRVSFLQTVFSNERGQVLPMVALMLVVLLGFTGLVVDVGHAYVANQQLQASTDAAALAASGALPDQSAATTVAQKYGAVSGGYNQVPILTNVTMPTPQYRCLTSLSLPCITSGGAATGGANAMTVTQTGKVNMTFGALVGFKSLTLTTKATVSMAGAVAPPYNVAIVVDTTASMNDTDSDPTCANTRIFCALSGIQILLQHMNPCVATSAANCGSADSSGNFSSPVDKVSIFTYPNITVGTVSADTNCGSTNPTAVAYTFPSATATTYAPGTSASTPTYQVVDYGSDYKSSDATSTLSTTSNLTAALGQGPKVGGKTCSGMAAPGGEGTFFAGAIYAAQASLAAQQASNKAPNVMIVLSDGDACAGAIAACGNNIKKGSPDPMAGASLTSTTYPSEKNQCQQAVAAAAAAKAAGTVVYTVAYGATSSGCASDSPAITPCQTMQQMAHDPGTFYSDHTASSGSKTNPCVSAAVSVTALADIFTSISNSLTLARLIPDNTQ